MRTPFVLAPLVITLGATAMLGLAGPAAAAPTTYYVDADAGRDGAAGTSPSTAWRSLDRVSGADLQPGDTVSFERGDTFVGQLRPAYSGTAGSPIRFTAYGNGSKPVLTGSGAAGGDYLAVVSIRNRDHLSFDNLRITNPRKEPRAGAVDSLSHGISVEQTGERDLVDFSVTDVDFANINSIALASEFNFNNQAAIAIQNRTGTKTIRDVTVADSTFTAGTRFGVAVNPDKTADNKNLVQDVTIRGNTCNRTGGSCFLGRRVSGLLIARNTVTDAGSSDGSGVQVERGSGGWIVLSRNVAIHENTFRGSRGGGDSAGFHLDGDNTNVVMQYNHMYDNQGYGLEILGGNDHVAVRYNVIVDSGWRKPKGGLVYISDFVPDQPRQLNNDLHIYENTLTFSRAQTISYTYFMTDSWVYNNIFQATGGAEITPLVKGPGSTGNTFRNNLYQNAGAGLVALDQSPVTGSPGFVGGDRSFVDSFRLLPTSAARDAGIDRPDPTMSFLGAGIFSAIAPTPTRDIYGATLTSRPNIGADQS